MGDTGGDQHGGAWSRVPVWDGSPQTWRTFQREMKWWTSSLDLEGTKKYNLAARWLLRQSGVVRQRGEEFNPEELQFQPEVKGQDPQTGDEVVLTPEDPLSGLNKLLKALEGINGKTTLDKRGELRNLFYLELKRKPGERIAEFCSRFRVALADLRTEGVSLPSGEVGWFFKTKLGLDPLRAQLLDTALQGSEEYETIEREVLRLFKDLHSQDPLVRKSFGDGNNKGGTLMQRFLTSQNPSSRPSSYAPSMASSAPRSFRTSTTSGSSSRFGGFKKPFPARQAMVSEAEEAEPEEEVELIEDEHEGEANLEEILKSEAEALAAELDEAADHGVDASTLQEIEESVETAAEALLTMKEARTKLQEVKRDRGYMKPSDGAPKSNPKKTAKNPCFDCGLPGHWAGDPECGKPGQGLARKPALKKPGGRQVKVVETLNTEHVDEAAGESHEVLTVSVQPLSQSFVDALEDAHSVTKEALIAQLAEDKRLVGALDSACNRTCAGPDWLKGYLHGLQSAPESIRSLVTSKPEHETFRFGNGGTKVSDMRWRLPTVIGGRLFCFWCSVVPVPSLGLLLGRDFLESIGADLSFSRRELCCERLGAEKIQLKQLAAGHYLLPLIPTAWPGVGSQRWRRIGQDGIIELQMSTPDWLNYCFKGQRSLRVTKHDHLLTEHSVHVGNLVCTVMSSPVPGPSVQASSMSSSAERRTPTPSSTTRTTSRTTVSNGRAQNRPASRQMASNAPQAERAHAVGRKRRPALGCAKALLALSALSVPINIIHRQMVGAGAEAGFSRSDLKAPLRAGGFQEAVHYDQSGRVHSFEKSPWPQVGFLRGPDGGRHDAGHSHERHGKQDPQGSSSRSSCASQATCQRQQARSRGPYADWAKGRTSSVERGPCAPCSPSPSASWRQRHHRGHQGKGEAYGGHPQREACAADGGQIFSESQGGQAEKQSQGRECFFNVYRSAPSVSTSRSSGQLDSSVGSSAEQASRREEQTICGGSHGSGHQVRSGIDRFRGISTSSRGDAGGLLRRSPESTVWRDRPGGPDSGTSRIGAGSLNFQDFNPFSLNQKLKSGQTQMIAQAWQKHEADRLKTSWGPAKIREALVADYENDFWHALTEETFIQPMVFDFQPSAVSDVNAVEKNFKASENARVSKNVKVSSNDKSLKNDKVQKNVMRSEPCAGSTEAKPFVTEVYTSAENVMKEARKRGHLVGQSMSLENGWNFLDANDRFKAYNKIRDEKPFCVVLAFPCNGFSPLQRLNGLHPERREERRATGRELMKFALEIAELQIREGRHVILENPRGSEAWNEPEMLRFLDENELYGAIFDQCRFGLKSILGELHKKPTRVVSSSSDVAAELDGVTCRRNHLHAPVLGGSQVTARAGIYPKPLARAMVRGLEKQFERQFAPREALAAEVGEDADEEELAFEGGGLVMPQDDGSDVEDEVDSKGKAIPVSASMRATILRLHQNTGHRSGKRLARALAIAGAPAEAIQAAKQLQCSVCQERQPPRARRPASLPVPRDMGDQIHVDLLEVFDASENKYVVAHATDAATRFQLSEILPDKSTRAVVRFLSTRWIATFGPPRVMVVDQGREFVSWEMEEFAGSQSILLHHIAVQAPWQNGIAERSGGVLKALLAAIVTSQSVIGLEDMQMALAEATSAYNSDINELGASPLQAAIGRQPRMVGDVLGGIQTRLAEHGLIDSKPSLARQLAMREVAKIGMTRLHFSRSLRRAELARSRNPTIEQAPEPGTICYFYRPLKYNNKTAPSKKKLTLKRWHGPALLLAIEGRSSGYLSYKGQLTKCALEHIRAASTMEQIAADSWREAIEEAVEAAALDLTARGLPSADGGDGAAPQQPAAEMPVPGTPAFLPSSAAAAPEQEPSVGLDLPPVQPQELADALIPASAPASSMPSRRMSEATLERATSAGLSSGLGDGLRKRASSFASQLQGAMESARRQRLTDPTGTKRAADTSLERLQADSSEPPVPQLEEPPVISTSAPEPAAEALQATRADVLSSLGDPSLHPLQHIYNAACEDRLNPTEVRVKDHGSWDGRWPLPSRTEWQAHQRLGLPWPCGHDELVENDVMAVQANRKEFHWRAMNDAEKAEFKIAAEQAWDVWKENDAVEELSPEESQRVRERLKREGQQGKILTPRYVFTDKHEGLRTEQNKLPLRARARIVVPGFKDIFSFGLRKDAPTCSRLAQHFLLTLTACFNVAAVGAELAWTLLSADIKSAFMKGDAYMDGTRELFMENIRGAPDEPRLPFPGLARIRKGVFGLSDAPRRWYLRLNKSLLQQGWQRTTLDYACWVLWSPCGTRLDGIIISHVDDLLLGGNSRAVAKLQELGQELGFGSTSEKDITYCGKRIRQLEDGSITITMEEYHSNLNTVSIPVHRRANPDSDLTELERRQLRAILGSLQWLVAQLRFDLGFQLSTLQGEPPKISTLMKANLLVKRFKQDPGFALTFKPMDLKGAGIMVVTDASLGNVTKAGGADGTVLEKVFSQSAYYVLLADKDLLAGREGSFSVLDARSHRLPRVCRSTYGAELLGAEEAFDVGCFCRGWWAMLQGLPIEHKRAEEVMDCIPLAVVTDARDVYDKSSSDTPSYGSQKSLAFTVAWIRGVLSKPNTMLKWTLTENLFVDCGTKDMSAEHVHKILQNCRWSVTFNQEFIKQKQKAKPKKSSGGCGESLLVGSALGENSPIYPYLAQLSASPGWHQREGVLINVARHAKSFRTPGARVDPKKFPLRTTYARIDNPDGKSSWRILEESTEYGILPNPHALLGTVAGILVTVYRSQATKKSESAEETWT